MISERVENRLTEIQDDFILRCEKASKIIFDKNNAIVFKELEKHNIRADAIENYHSKM